MHTFRGYGLSAGKLSEIVSSQQVAGLTVGRSPRVRLYLLPCATWKQEIDKVYGDAHVRAKRVNTGTSKENGMSEGILLDVLTDQCGAQWDPRGGEIAVVKLGDTDAAYMVPANEFWRERAEGEA